MSGLFINNQNTNDLDNCDYFFIIKLNITRTYNINLLLDKLYKFINLQELYLSNNKITEIKGLDNLVNLQTLYLNDNQNQEISDGLCMCFTGRLTRLLNTLVGFYDDIELQISDSKQITNIIMGLKNKFASGEELRDAVKKELVERQYSESIINEWLEYI